MFVWAICRVLATRKRLVYSKLKRFVLVQIVRSPIYLEMSRALRAAQVRSFVASSVFVNICRASVIEIPFAINATSANLLMRVTPIVLPFGYQYSRPDLICRVLWVRSLSFFVGVRRYLNCFRSPIRVILHVILRSMPYNLLRISYLAFL